MHFFKVKFTIKTTTCLFLLDLLIHASKVTGQNNLRPVETLISDTSGWQVIENAIKISRVKFEILPADHAKAKEAIYQSQVTARSPMGAIIYLTGGILIDDGWIRILGSGNAKLNRSLPQWNKGKTYNELGEKPKFLLVADDAIGGFFAINGGAFGSDPEQIYYLAPDDLKWEAQHITYAEFINFCFVGNMKQYYSGLRWQSWNKDVKILSGDQAFSIYPFLWTKEGKDIEKDSRKIVPVQELYDFENNELQKIKK